VIVVSMESLAKNFKLSSCGRQPSLCSLSFDLVCLFCFLFLLYFSGQVFAIQV
jgi:hypothetical protein